MEITFVTSHFGSDPTVGFMPVMATELTRRGHDVEGVQYESGETIEAIPIERLKASEIYTPYWAGQWAFYLGWKETIQKYLTDNRPEAVVADRRCMVPTIDVASQLNIPVVGVIPGLGFTRFNPQNFVADKKPTFWSLPKSAKLQYPFVKSLYRQHVKGLRRVDGLISVSEFLRKTVRSTFGVDSDVVRTPVVPETVEAEAHNPRYITMVNPRSELKGTNIFLDIVKVLPECEFLVAGVFGSEADESLARKLSNVTVLGWVDDMKEVYKDTKILLVPSLVEEGGPRTIVEAFVNGIPVVGTERGGIPEFIGGAGATVDPPSDINQWIKKISQVQNQYKRYANRAKNRASVFHIDQGANTFEAVLEDAVAAER